MYIYIYICACIHTHIHTYIHIDTYVDIDIYTRNRIVGVIETEECVLGRGRPVGLTRVSQVGVDVGPATKVRTLVSP